MKHYSNYKKRKNKQHLLKIVRGVNIFSLYCLEAQDQKQALEIFNAAYL